MINSVSFGSGEQTQKSNKGKNATIGGILGAGAAGAVAATTKIGKAPIASDAAQLMSLDNDKFESTMKDIKGEGDKAADIDAAKETITKERTSSENATKEVDNKIKTIFGEGDKAKTDITPDEAVKNMDVPFEKAEDLKNAVNEKAETALKNKEEVAEAVTKKAEGLENSKKGEVFVSKEGKLLEKAEGEHTVIKVSKTKDGKPKVGAKNLETYQKEVTAERKTFDKNKVAFEAISGKEKITPDDMKAILTTEAKEASDKAKGAFETIKDSIPTKINTGKVAMIAAAGLLLGAIIGSASSNDAA